MTCLEHAILHQIVSLKFGVCITNVNLSYKNMLYFGLNRRILEWAIDVFWGFDAILFVKIELT